MITSYYDAQLALEKEGYKIAGRTIFGDTTVSIHISYYSIDASAKLDALQKVVGDNFQCYYDSNECKIFITKKKKC
jgi:hypothetical protein